MNSNVHAGLSLALVIICPNSKVETKEKEPAYSHTAKEWRKRIFNSEIHTLIAVPFHYKLPLSKGGKHQFCLIWFTHVSMENR